MESAIPKYRTNVIVSRPRKVALVDRGAHGSPDHALVLVRPDGSMTTRTRRPSLWESLRFQRRYDVNTQVQCSTWTRYLRSADPEGRFRADVRVLWHVTGPVQAVRRELHTVDDAERVIAAVLHAHMEEITEHQRPDRIDETSQRVNTACAAPPDLGDSGITVLDVAVRISVPGHVAPSQQSGHGSAPFEFSPELTELLRRAGSDPRRLHDTLSRIVEWNDPQPVGPLALLDVAASGLGALGNSAADAPDARPQAPRSSRGGKGHRHPWRRGGTAHLKH